MNAVDRDATSDLIAEARLWPRDGVNEGRLINSLADALATAEKEWDRWHGAAMLSAATEGNARDALAAAEARADRAEAERARPTLDRETVLSAIRNHGNVVGASSMADAILAAVGQDTPATEGALPEWTDPEPWVNPVTGARDEAEWDGVVGAPIYSPRTREQYDAE